MTAAANCFFWVAFRCNHIASSPWELFWTKKKKNKKVVNKKKKWPQKPSRNRKVRQAGFFFFHFNAFSCSRDLISRNVLFLTDNLSMMVAIAYAQEKGLSSMILNKFKIHETISSETRLVIYSSFLPLAEATPKHAFLLPFIDLKNMIS